MTPTIDSISQGIGSTARAPSSLQLNESSVVHFLGRAQGPKIYPRLISHEAIMIRTLAIADNLDEVMMLPQGYVFPLRTRKQSLMRRKVDKTKGTDSTQLGKRRRDPEEGYDDEDLEEI